MRMESVWFWGEPLEVLTPLRYPPPMEHAFASTHVYQFRVVVQGISSLIWRRLHIRSDMSLATPYATASLSVRLSIRPIRRGQDVQSPGSAAARTGHTEAAVSGAEVGRLGVVSRHRPALARGAADR
jgi:hypothetical protein